MSVLSARKRTANLARRASPVDEIRFTVIECSLGLALVAASARGLCAILLGDDAAALARDLEKRFPGALLSAEDASLARHASAVAALIAKPAAGLELPLDVRGTAFQRRVWDALCEIPPGTTASYAEVARRIGQPSAARAVAAACAANHLAVVIPCHRVVRSDRSLSGYRWGVSRKASLLHREQAGC